MKTIQTTTLSNQWERVAQRAAAPPERAASVPLASLGPKRQQDAGGTMPCSTLASLKLTREEVLRLTQKGLASGGAAVEREVLDLVRLTHPDGWTILIGYVRVTPALAGRWLRVNFGNRPVSDDVVTAYARDAVAGVWLTTHQGIAFNDKDELIDGQHRLLAIVQSGVDCVLMVSFGWISKVEGREMKRMDVIDRGLARSVAHQLKIQHGLKDGTPIAQITAGLSNLCYGDRTRRLTMCQTLEIYRAFEPALRWVIERRSRQHGLRAAGVLAAFTFALRTEEKHSLTSGFGQLFERLNLGTIAPADAPIAQLREFLTSDDAKLMTASCNRSIAEITLNAILLEQNGATVLKPSQLAENLTAGTKHFAALQPERVAKIAALFKLPANVSREGAKEAKVQA